jgi:RNA-directed DNA polymerase
VTAWEEVTSFQNLRSAALRAARGKRAAYGVARFLERLEPEVWTLQRELRTHAWKPGRPVLFTIRDPKERTITAAPFRDRVVHQALLAPLEARFDAELAAESFACRKGMGTHRALDFAQAGVLAWPWFLKLDVAKCFESIEHPLVLRVLRRIGLEPELLALCERILAGPLDAPARGLPIGNLTSQWFANLALGELDRFVKAELAPRGYVRYMDDFVLFGADKQGLRSAHERIEACAQELGLELKHRATMLAPTSNGLPFLGWRLYPGIRRLRPENRRRALRRLKQRRWELRTGKLSRATYEQSVRSTLAHVGHPDALSTRHMLLCACAEEATSGCGP